jgi:4-diphosphocytidyl-2-C-methyl-D-erythritol kinase
MAGGSSDCATTMIGVNQMFGLGLDKEQLMERGVKLGADVPYCILGGTAIARGIGEILTPLPTPPDCYVVVAKPAISVSTAYVYGHIKPGEIKVHPDIEGMVKAIKNQELKELAGLLYNVMEDVTVPEYPIVGQIKAAMLKEGALGSIMSGSGPTVFGLYDDLPKAQNTINFLQQDEMIEQIYLTKFI